MGDRKQDTQTSLRATAIERTNERIQRLTAATICFKAAAATANAAAAAAAAAASAQFDGRS